VALHNPSAKQKAVQVAFKKARREGLGGKALGRRIKQLLGKRKSNPSKRPKTKQKKTRTSNRKSNPKKNVVARKGGTKGMTRIKKLLLGLGIGTTVSLVSSFVRIPGLEGSAPILDAAVGGGVEGQIGVAIPRIIRQVAGLAQGNGGGGFMVDGSA